MKRGLAHALITREPDKCYRNTLSLALARSHPAVLNACLRPVCGHQRLSMFESQNHIMRGGAVSRTTTYPFISASIVFGLLLGGFALSPVSAASRDSAAEKKNSDYYIELVRRDVRQDAREIIGEKLALKQAEAEKFWPVYDRYEAELRRLGDAKLTLINDYADNYKSMTDAKASELTSKAIELDIQRTSLLKQYLPEFQKALTNRRAAQFYQIEMPLLKIVDLQIASQMPAMP
jgi:hypothetical protein